MRLTWKLGLLMSLLAITVLLLALSFLYSSERRHLREQLERQQRVAVEKLARVCAESISDANEIALLSYFKTLLAAAAPGEVAWAALLDQNGRTRTHSDFLKGDFALRGKPALPSGGLMLRAMPVLSGGQRLGSAVIAFNERTVERMVAEIQRDSLRRYGKAAIGGLFVSLLFAYGLAGALSRPIRELGRGAHAIGQGKLQTRVPETRSDELGDLAREFNAMAKKLGELDALKDAFVAQITHDLRSPLTALIGTTELLETGLLGPINQQQAEALGVSKRGGRYLAELIDNILDVTRLETGKLELSRERVDLRAMVEEAFQLIQSKADEFHVALDRSLIAEGSTVHADRQELKRVLVNLISNAIKFTPEGGRVSVEYKKDPSGTDVISVRDTGIGIPPEKIGALFQKFSQVAETRNKVRPSGGTGLGLVICKQIVEAHGGKIWAQSAYRKGSVFAFTLPRQT